MSVGNAALAPRMKSLWAEAELRAERIEADGGHQRVVGVPLSGHTPVYQRAVYISSGETLIGRAERLMQKLRMANNPEFGARLRSAIDAAGYKNPRRFAIEGLGLPEASGPQRVQNYLKGRIPDLETVVQIAEAAKTTVSDLLGIADVSETDGAGLQGILRQLMQLEGIPPDRADTIASAAIAAQRLLQAFPDEEPLPTRAKFAAHAVWHQQRSPEPGT